MAIKNRVTSFLHTNLSWERFRSDHEAYLHLILTPAVAFALFMHVFLLAFYATLAVTPLAIFNVFSVLLYASLFLAVHNKRYAITGLLLSAEVLLYALFSSFCIGSDNFVILYFFLILVMQLMIPYAAWQLRAVIVVLIGLCICFAVALGANHPPGYRIGTAAVALSYFNMLAAFLGILIQLTIGNFINRMIAAHNSSEMEAFRNQAYTDTLTGLFNRRYAEKCFKEPEAAEAARCVAMLDIDFFKRVNDTYGHGVGDLLLIRLSEIMRQNLRKSDLLFRWGGEEFLIVLDDVGIDTAERILEKLRKNIEESPFDTGDTLIRFTVTIGVAPFETEAAEACIEFCDQNLYFGKRNGKNRVVTPAVRDAEDAEAGEEKPTAEPAS